PRFRQPSRAVRRACSRTPGQPASETKSLRVLQSRPRRCPYSTTRAPTSDGTPRASRVAVAVTFPRCLPLLLLLAVASSPAAHAAGEPRELAAAHYRRGIELAKQGLYGEALEQFN